jgi:hypothetical protein
MLALSVLGLVPTDAPVALGVLCVTAVFSFDPDSAVADAQADGTAAPDTDVDTDADTDADADEGRASPFPVEEESRAPWL